MSRRVYAFDVEPDNAKWLYNLSDARALDMLTEGKARPIWVGDIQAVQLYPPEGWLPERVEGGFAQAWHIKPSGGFPCWQMDTK